MFPSGSQHTRVYSDKRIEWRPGRLYLPAMCFTGMSVSAINEGGAANDAYGVNWEGSHTGAPISKEISSFGFNGVLLDTNGDQVVTDHLLPYDFDIAKNAYVRVHWACGSTDTANTIDWKVLYRALIPEVTALAAPSTALNTVIAQDLVPVATAYTVNRSPWGTINAGSIDPAAEHMAWLVEMTTFAVGLSEDKFLLGLELLYSPKRMRGPDGMAREASIPVSMLDNRY